MPTATGVAYWKHVGRARMVLWEGLGGFGDRILATVEKASDGTWNARTHTGEQSSFRIRRAALLHASRCVSQEFGLEVRTATTVVIPRPERTNESERGRDDA